LAFRHFDLPVTIYTCLTQTARLAETVNLLSLIAFVSLAVQGQNGELGQVAHGVGGGWALPEPGPEIAYPIARLTPPLVPNRDRIANVLIRHRVHFCYWDSSEKLSECKWEDICVKGHDALRALKLIKRRVGYPTANVELVDYKYAKDTTEGISGLPDDEFPVAYVADLSNPIDRRSDACIGRAMSRLRIRGETYDTADGPLSPPQKPSEICVPAEDALRVLKLIKRHCGFPIPGVVLIDYQAAKKLSYLARLPRPPEKPKHWVQKKGVGDDAPKWVQVPDSDSRPMNGEQ